MVFWNIGIRGREKILRTDKENNEKNREKYSE
jgi:hypothetical protein